MSPPAICFRFDPLARATIGARGPAALLRTVSRLGAELRLTAEAARAAGAEEPVHAWSVLDAAAWTEGTFDLLSLDEQVARRAAAGSASESPVKILIRAARRAPGPRLTGRRLLGVTRQVLTRYQRFCRSRNAASSVPAFDRALALHEGLHDRSKPLVAADFDHALDTWRWVLRLDGDASLAVQLAALFHDIERLDTEADARIEHLAPDYVAFKTAHAAAGARRVAELLTRIDVSRDDARRTCDLVERHELGGAASDRTIATPTARPRRTARGLDDEGRLLAEADALSFFSLNASGFLRYYGPEHTARKVAYTLRRLGPAGRRELRRLKVPGPIHTMLGTLETNQLNETNDMNEMDPVNEASPLNRRNAIRDLTMVTGTRPSLEEPPS